MFDFIFGKRAIYLNTEERKYLLSLLHPEYKKDLSERERFLVERMIYIMHGHKIMPGSKYYIASSYKRRAEWKSYPMNDLPHSGEATSDERSL